MGAVRGDPGRLPRIAAGAAVALALLGIDPALATTDTTFTGPLDTVTGMVSGTGGQLAAALAMGAALVGSVLHFNAMQLMGAVGVGVAGGVRVLALGGRRQGAPAGGAHRRRARDPGYGRGELHAALRSPARRHGRAAAGQVPAVPADSFSGYNRLCAAKQLPGGVRCLPSASSLRIRCHSVKDQAPRPCGPSWYETRSQNSWRSAHEG